jgi:hypothetical protein
LFCALNKCKAQIRLRAKTYEQSCVIHGCLAGHSDLCSGAPTWAERGLGLFSVVSHLLFIVTFVLLAIVVGYLCLIRALSECKDGDAAEQFLTFVTEQKLLLLAMMADASDECIIMVRLLGSFSVFICLYLCLSRCCFTVVLFQ